MYARNFKLQFKDLLENTYLPSNASLDETIAVWNKINNLLFKNIPSKLFRFRKYNIFNISSFEKGSISMCVADQFSDKYDSYVFVDKKSIREKIEDAKNSPILAALIELVNSFGLQNTFYVFKDREDTTISDTEFFYQLKKEKNLDSLFNSVSSIIDAQINYIRKDKLTKIACFTEDITSKFMWDMYADGYKGYALEYDFTQFHLSGCTACNQRNKCQQCNYSSLYPVIYSEKRYNATNPIENLVVRTILRQYGISMLPTFPDMLYWYKVYLYKDKDEYLHECEWRIISRCEASQHEIFSEIPDLGCLKAIYYGPCIEEDHKNKLRTIAKQKKLKEYDVGINDETSDYKLRIFPIE